MTYEGPGLTRSRAPHALPSPILPVLAVPDLHRQRETGIHPANVGFVAEHETEIRPLMEM